MIDAMLHILAKDPGEKPARKAKSDEREHPAKITASVSIAKGMAQKALAPAQTRNGLSAKCSFARQDVKLNRPEAIRRLVKFGLKAKK